MIKWKNARAGTLPVDGQEVLLEADGEYYFTVFDAEKELFRLRDEPGSFFSLADKAPYYWIGIGEPPVTKEVAEAG